MSLDVSRLESRNQQWVGFSVSPKYKAERRIYMLSAILQTLVKLSIMFGLVFMIACTVFVIVCIAHGDIKVKIVRNEAEKENE